MTIKKRRNLKRIVRKRGSGCRPIKVDKETHGKLKSFSRQLSALQDSNVSMGEAIRRLTRLQNSRLVLEKDAQMKRGLKK